MDLKAFDKLYTETVEAIAERRLTDAISLTEAISRDNSDADLCHEDFTKLREDYSAILRPFKANGFDAAISESFQDLFRRTIELLQKVRYQWEFEHDSTFFGRMSAEMKDYGVVALDNQLIHASHSKVGNQPYHLAVDAAFVLFWIAPVNEEHRELLAYHLRQQDHFSRCVMVGGLMMSGIDCFSETKIQLLLELGQLAMKDLQNADLIEDEGERQRAEKEAQDLMGRVAVALTLVYQHNRAFFPFFPKLDEGLRTFFHAKVLKPHLPDLLQAFVCQSLTDRVGKRIDDLLPIIKELTEKQQPRLNPGEEEEKTDEWTQDMEDIFETKVTRIELKGEKSFFNKMANYARSVDTMRQMGMDVNHINLIAMKRSDFFKHTAHWFYPFSMEEPFAKKGLHLANGKLDAMTVNIMNHSRFCDCDRYSYAGMMSLLRRGGRKSISDRLDEQFNQMAEEEGVSNPFDEIDENDYSLNPFTNFCQVCYRFFYGNLCHGEYDFTFAATDDIILPLLPYFEGQYSNLGDIEDSIYAYLMLGDSQHAIVLLNYFMEHHVTTAKALELRAHAFMQQQQWRSAISDIQQSLLINDNDDLQLDMARCFEALSDWDSAIPLLLHEDERREGKDADLTEEIGRGFIQLRRWDEAVQRFFKLEFMGTHLAVSQRGIGWCSLHQGKYERAAQYYQAIIQKAKKPLWEDYINLGHALWLQGRTAEAVEAYRKSFTCFNRAKKAQRQQFRHWGEAFNEDARSLLASHFSTEELAIMTDAVTTK